MSDFMFKNGNWATDTANDPGYVHERATKLLEDIKTAGENAVPILVDALLNDPDPTVRERAANELRFQKGTGITEALIKVLKNKDEYPLVLEMAAEAAGNHDVNKAVPALVSCLKNPSPEVRFWSVVSLGHSGCRKVIPRLRSIAKYDRREIQVFGSIAARARQAISEIKGAYYIRSSKKLRRPIEL
jgi:HEAT repeat protein